MNGKKAKQIRKAVRQMYPDLDGTRYTYKRFVKQYAVNSIALDGEPKVVTLNHAQVKLSSNCQRSKIKQEKIAQKRT